MRQIWRCVYYLFLPPRFSAYINNVSPKQPDRIQKSTAFTSNIKTFWSALVAEWLQRTPHGHMATWSPPSNSCMPLHCHCPIKKFQQNNLQKKHPNLNILGKVNVHICMKSAEMCKISVGYLICIDARKQHEQLIYWLNNHKGITKEAYEVKCHYGY